MLNNVYKIIAKALALRLTTNMKQWITKEQKGFIKGRYILDSIIALWEGVEHAEKTNQDFIFFKIDFDKAYDRLNWDYILQSLGDMGLGPKFIHMVKTLFGNAKAKVICNGELTKAISLTRSIRQGCPLAPLLYAIAADGLNWLIKDKVIKGEIQGITLPDGEQLCTQMFADDTNILINNEEDNIKSLWDCLQVYCEASGSRINHNKTGIKTLIEPPPKWLLEAGCNPIQEGTIFRLLGIPMGFKVSLKQRWQWVMEKVEGKLTRWKRRQLTLAGRIMILNHFIIPSVIYFLSCWRPPDGDIKRFTRLCRNYLWGGDPWNNSMPKVKWDFCTIPKEVGGLGIRDINHTADRLASKWIIRSLANPKEDWAQLILKDIKKFSIAGHNKWVNLPDLTIIVSHMISHLKEASCWQLTFWKAWNRVKQQLSIKVRKLEGIIGNDSIWWSLLPMTPLNPKEEAIAILLHKKGVCTWKDISNNLDINLVNKS